MIQIWFLTLCYFLVTILILFLDDYRLTLGFMLTFRHRLIVDRRLRLAMAAGGLVVTLHGRIGLRRVEHLHAVAGRSGPHDVQMGESAAEVLQLKLHLLRRQTVFGDLPQILFGKHRLSSN